MTKKFYVYKVFLKDEVIYVGKGQGSRCQHVLSGKSHNAKLNEYYYRHTLLGDECPVVKKVKYFEDDELALKYESYLIRDLLPDCNIRGAKDKFQCKSKPKARKKPNVEKVKQPVQEETIEDNLINLPDTYEEFYKHMEGLYESYLENSVAKEPQPLKWFCYGKMDGKMWQPYLEFLKRMFDELDLEHKQNPIKTGRKEGFPKLLNFTIQEKRVFVRC